MLLLFVVIKIEKIYIKGWLFVNTSGMVVNKSCNLKKKEWRI